MQFVYPPVKYSFMQLIYQKDKLYMNLRETKKYLLFKVFTAGRNYLIDAIKVF